MEGPTAQGVLLPVEGLADHLGQGWTSAWGGEGAVPPSPGKDSASYIFVTFLLVDALQLSIFFVLCTAVALHCECCCGENH